MARIRECFSIGWLANPCCTRRLRHICVYSTPTEPDCGSYFNYAERTLFTVFYLEGTHYQACSQSQQRQAQTLSRDDLWLRASIAIDCAQILPSTQFH